MKNRQGFQVVGIIIAVAVVALIAVAAFFVIDGNNNATDYSNYDFNSIIAADKHTGNIAGTALFDPIVVQLPGLCPVKQHPTQGLLPLLGSQIGANIRKFGIKTDHLRVFLCAKAPSAAQKRDGLQQIGLALGIISHDQIHAGIKVQV